MNKKYIEKIQKKILELLPEEKRQKKMLLLEDSCSELSRLAASWMNENDKSSRQAILKGDNVCNTNKSHDILASIKNGKVYLIDPTIWQFFPDENSILIGEYTSLDEAFAAVTKKYSGNWQKSEDLKEISSKEKNELLEIILEIIKDNIKESLNKGQS